MSRSLRAYAGCIGLAERFRLRNDFFGYTTSPPWKPDTSSEPLPGVVSVSRQMDRLHKRFFNIAIFNFSGIDESTNAALAQRIDCAVQIARDIYARAGFGIGRVYRVATASLGTPTPISAESLVDDFGVDSDAIEVFLIGTYASPPGTTTLGETPAFGDGITVSILQNSSRASSQMGRTLAHELGHFLLHGPFWHAWFEDDHVNRKPSNLMCQSGNALRDGNGFLDLVVGCFLDSNQRSSMNGIDWVRDPCYLDELSGPEEPIPPGELSDEERQQMEAASKPEEPRP